MAIFGSVYFCLQWFGFCSWEIYQIFCFLALKHTPVWACTGPHWHYPVKKKKKRCLNLFHWNFAAACFVSLCCHVIWGSVLDTVQCIKMSETCNFPEGNGRSVEDRNILLFAKCIAIWSPNLLFGFPKNIFSESDIWSLIFFKYFERNSVGKGKWNYL